MTAQMDWNVVDDAELVGAAVAGDRAAFAGIYDRYADRLYDFCVGMVGNHDAADCVQEAFCMAAVDLPKLRDANKLRPWLYAIARHQALRVLRARHRETTFDGIPDQPSTEAGPETLAARNELAALVTLAEAGLSDRDREVLNLTYRHGLTGAELAQALGVSDDSAKKLVQRFRNTLERSLGALLVARQAESGLNRCPELATIVAGWNGQFTILLRKRISRHIQSCANCDEDRGRLVNPAALLGASPLLIPAPTWLREQTLSQIQHAPVASASAAGRAAHALARGSAHLPAATAKFALWAAAIVAVPALALGTTAGWTALHTVAAPAVQIAPSVSTTPSSQQPIESASTSNVTTSQSVTSAPPVAAAEPNGPDPDGQGTQPGPQAPSPTPTATAAPNVVATAPTSQATPPSPDPLNPRKIGLQAPPVKFCPGGGTVAGDQSCPAPKPAAPSQCSHVAVQGSPICPQTAAPAKTTSGRPRPILTVPGH
jgi:RNA polymerase sigma factor (sigma-70 family)